MSSEQLKQPATLYTISAAYMCERFGYYMLRTIMVLYMINMLMVPTAEAYSTFAAFSALMFLSPLVGGKFIDRDFDHAHAAMSGGIMLALGLFFIAFCNAHFLNIALGLIICGKGFHTPGIIASIGQIYHHGDNRRERGFMLMYSAINVSAITASLSAPAIIFYCGWKIAFCTAGVMSLIGTFILYYHNSQKIDYKPMTSTQMLDIALVSGAGMAILTMILWSEIMSDVFMIALSTLLFLYTFLTLATLDEVKRKQSYICFALTGFATIFFALSQQSAMSLTVFTENNVHRTVGGFVIPTFYFLALDPFFIILLTPIIGVFWRILNQADLEPTPAVKFALGTMLTGTGFIILMYAITCMHTPDGKIDYLWLVLSYFFQTMGELLIIPVGLAMITDLAPRQMIGFMIGSWYFMIAIANQAAGIASRYTIQLPHVNKHPLTGPLAAYAHVFGTLGTIAILSGVGLLMVNMIFSSKAIPQRVQE